MTQTIRVGGRRPEDDRLIRKILSPVSNSPVRDESSGRSPAGEASGRLAGGIWTVGGAAWSATLWTHPEFREWPKAAGQALGRIGGDGPVARDDLRNAVGWHVERVD